MENNLPQGWAKCSLIDLCSKPQYGWTSKAGGSGVVKYLRTTDISSGDVEWETVPYCVEEPNEVQKYQVKKDDILVSRAGSVGFNHRIKDDVPFEAVFASYLIRFQPYDETLAHYIEYFLKSEEYWSQILDFTAGIAIPNVNASKLEQLDIPLPPEGEIKRIIDKLDSLFEKIEINKKRLERIPHILKRFRQSVLADAVNNNGLEEITKNVCEEIQIGPFGTQLHRHEYISNGIPLVNPTHIQGGEIIPDFTLTITQSKFEELSNYHLKVGDVIMGRRGEMARCALIGPKEEGWLCGTGSLFFRPNLKKVIPQYLYWVLSNSNTKAFLEGEAKGSTMSNLNLNIVRNIPIPLPSIEEQKVIVKKVEDLFAFSDAIEDKYIKAKAQFDKIPYSILSKAFHGELVPQDPTDEPAVSLLERIRREKDNIKRR